MTTAERLRWLANRVQANVPSHRRPDQFHTEKSDISAEIRQIAKSIEEHTA